MPRPRRPVFAGPETFRFPEGYTGVPISVRMLCFRWLAVSAVLLSVSFGASFGTVVPLVGGASDLVLDEGRARLYLVNSALNQVEVYSIPQRRFLTPIRAGRTPLAAAMSRNGKLLYLTSYDGSALEIIDLDQMASVQSVSLPAKPEGVAVGADERVLITTIGTGPSNALTNTLLLYDPQATATRAITNVILTPPPPTPPQLPPPSGRPFLSYRSQLIATKGGERIVGLNLSGSNRIVFVYEVASGTVLRSRLVSGASTVLSVSPDGSKFMAGLNLFDAQTLAVLAQQNAANAPFTFPDTANANFNTQQNQGGSVFSPDGTILYTAFNIAPDENPPARPNASRMLLNDPDNLLITMGLELPENLTGKFLISSDGATIFALSESGFLTIPISSMSQYPIAQPDTQVLMLSNDQCGVMAQNRTADVRIRNAGAGRMTATASLLQLPQTGPQGVGGIGGAGGGGAAGGIIIILPSPTPSLPGVPVSVPGQTGVAATTQQQTAVSQSAPRVTTRQTSDGAIFQFSFSTVAANSLGTITPPHTFLIQAPEAINIPPTIRVYQNNRNSEARADVIPAQLGTALLEGLVDLVPDTARQRLYIANSGLNRVEVFDLRTRRFSTSIKVGQLPRSVALTPDGNTLYVANTGGESISIVDLNKGAVTGRVRFPPIPFNASAPLVTPQVIATGLSGLQIMMSNGTLWQVIGNDAVPRPVSPAIGADSSGRPLTISAPRSLVSTPGGEYILLLAGNGWAYLYDAMADEFVMSRQLFTRATTGAAAGTTLQGLYGAVAAGPRGQYFLANGLILNQSLTPVGSTPGVAGPTDRSGQQQTLTRPVAAVAPVGTTTFARVTQPVQLTQNALLTDTPSVEIVDVNTGATLRSAQTVEGPLATATGASPALTGINGRTMAVDASGSTAYVLTTSGLSIVPLDAPARADQPQITARGMVSSASYQPSVASGQLVSIFGRNLGSTSVAQSTPLPTLMGGVCITANNRPLPLLMTSSLQVNAQVPPEMASGRYSVVVRAIEQRNASTAYSLTVSKYAPAVFVDPQTGQAAIFHPDGRLVTKDHPARRDERLVIYATGLGLTKGGRVTGGLPAPREPLAVTEPVQVFFGRTDYKQSEMIVEWSGLAPGFVGLNQINIYVPGDHMRGDALPVTLRIAGIESPKAGPAIPSVALE